MIFNSLFLSLFDGKLAVSISDNTNKIAGSICAKLKKEEDNKTGLSIEEEMAEYIYLSPLPQVVILEPKRKC